MAARLAGALACLALGTWAEEPLKELEAIGGRVAAALGAPAAAAAAAAAAPSTVAGRRRFPDEQVVASQRYFSRAWRDRFNERNIEYCAGAYLEEASLQVALGPAAAELKRLLNLADPAVFHGRSAIGHFWNESMRIGLGELRAYEERGDYASTSLAVDDDTVIVRGRFSFGSRASGQIFSETWLRAGEEWKLRSAVLAFQDFDASAPAPPPPSPAAGAAAAAPAVAAELPATGRSSGVGPMLLLAILATCGVAGVLLRRTRRRREAAVAGFEAMLG